MNKYFQYLPLFLVLLIVDSKCFGQSITIPQLSEIQKASDFRKSEKKVLEMIDWLGSTNSFNSKNERKKAIDFINSYVEKHPYLVYNPSKGVNKLRKRSEYGLQFKLGWVQYLLTYEYSKNSFANHKRALAFVLEFYDQHRDRFGKNSYLEKIKSKKQLNELDGFIKSEL